MRQHHRLTSRERRALLLLLAVCSIALVALVIVGVVTERSAETPLVRAGQPAPDFSLPATTGQTMSLAELAGRPVVLVFVPSVLCESCKKQLRAVQQVHLALRDRGGTVLAVSTDTPAVQRFAVTDLDLDFPLVSEAPTVGQHPAGSAYGVYHLTQLRHGPVDANAVFVIDAKGIVRGVQVQPGRAIAADTILNMIEQGLGPAERRD